MIYYIPIEPLEERYTEQWFTEFPKEFRKAGFKVQVIEGISLTNTVETGTFLDINSTIAYKNSQMIQISELFYSNKVQENDIFFFGDTEFWGIESLRLMSDMNKVKIKIYSFLHAASYIEEDAFQIAEEYQKYTELGWILSADKVFVGTQHHKNVIIDKRFNLATKKDKQKLIDKIVVTGNPIFKEVYHKFNIPKQNKIILPNRFDYEKRPNISLDIAVVFKRLYPDWEIVVTTSRDTFKSNKQWLIDYALALEEQNVITIKYNLSKEEYHKEIAESKFMLTTNTVEETFGYCVAEAVNYNTLPICPNKLSHPELLEFDKDLLYNDIDDIIPMIEHLMFKAKNIQFYNDKYYNVINKMIKEFNE